MVIDGLSVSQACNSCEKEARPMDAIYNVMGLSTRCNIPKDREKIAKYNHLNRKMVDTCWKCPRGPMKPCSRCKKCVKVHLDEILPIDFNLD